MRKKHRKNINFRENVDKIMNHGRIKLFLRIKNSGLKTNKASLSFLEYKVLTVVSQHKIFKYGYLVKSNILAPILFLQ